MKPFYPTHPGPALDTEAIAESHARIVRGVELWKQIMSDEIASWSGVTDFKPARDRLMHQLRLGGFATYWPGVTYFYKDKAVFGPGITY